MARTAPALPHVHDRARLPPIPAAQTGQRGKKESPDLRHNPACQQCAKPSLTLSPNRRQHYARIAENSSIMRKCQSSARVSFAVSKIDRRGTLFKMICSLPLATPKPNPARCRRRACYRKYQALAFKLSATFTPCRSSASTILPAPSNAPQNIGPPR